MATDADPILLGTLGPRFIPGEMVMGTTWLVFIRITDPLDQVPIR